MIRESLQYSRHNNCTFDHLTIFKYTEKKHTQIIQKIFHFISTFTKELSWSHVRYIVLSY